jgi:hypothetical protein
MAARPRLARDRAAFSFLLPRKRLCPGEVRPSQGLADPRTCASARAALPPGDLISGPPRPLPALHVFILAALRLALSVDLRASVSAWPPRDVPLTASPSTDTLASVSVLQEPDGYRRDLSRRSNSGHVRGSAAEAQPGTRGQHQVVHAGRQASPSAAMRSP